MSSGGWGSPKDRGAGTTGEIDTAHNALDRLGVPGGNLAARVQWFTEPRSGLTLVAWARCVDGDWRDFRWSTGTETPEMTTGFVPIYALMAPAAVVPGG